MITAGERSIGGGILLFEPKMSDGTVGEEFEVGEIQEATFTMSTESAEAFSKDGVMKKLVEKVTTSIGGSLKFTTQKFTSQNVAMAMLGVSGSETFEIGDSLPDGTIATVKVEIPFIAAGERPNIEGKFTFIGDEDGAFKPVLVIFNASVVPTGDIGYIMDSFGTLSFEGAVLETDEGYAKEYRMKVSSDTTTEQTA